MVDKTLDETHSMDNIYGGEIYIGAAESDSFQLFAKIAKNIQKKFSYNFPFIQWKYRNNCGKIR